MTTYRTEWNMLLPVSAYRSPSRAREREGVAERKDLTWFADCYRTGEPPTGSRKSIGLLRARILWWPFRVRY